MSRPGFYNDNEGRSYPLVKCPPSLRRVSDGMLFELPKEVFVDFGALMGIDSGYIEAVHHVYLKQVCRIDDVFYFEFRSDAPGTFDRSLIFSRPVLAERWLTEDVEDTVSGIPCDTSSDSSAASVASLGSVDSASSISSADSVTSFDCPEPPIWDGFLVTGGMTELAEVMDNNDSWVATDDTIRVEPALIRSLLKTYVKTLNLANADRTRAASSVGCPDLIYPYPTGGIIINDQCLTGSIQFKPGYNATVFQSAAENSLTVGAEQGSGEGNPCDPPKLFAGEIPPEGRTTLDGGFLCNEIVRSFNGVGGRDLQFSSNKGVSIDFFPDQHKIVIDVDMSNLEVCYSAVSGDPESAESC